MDNGDHFQFLEKLNQFIQIIIEKTSNNVDHLPMDGVNYI
jgi:hypothetical protein